MKIKPFKAIRYNQDKIPLDKVVAPPYDVINKERQDQLYNLHQNNIIRLILGKELPNDNDAHNKYSRAGEFLNNWLNEQILIQDDKPAIYIYEQDFELEGKKHSRLGIFALVKVEKFGEGSVLPHEKTMKKPKADRLNLMKATNTNLCPIFTLYEENNVTRQIIKKTQKSKPIVKLIDERGIKDVIWQITNNDEINLIIEELKNKDLFIADGHHRYETALNFKEEHQAKNPNHHGEEKYNYVLTYMVDMGDPGLIILPAHRIVTVNSGKESFVNMLNDSFKVSAINNKDSLIKLMKTKPSKLFGLYYQNRYYLLEYSATIDELDVEILQNEIINKILGINYQQIEKFVSFTKDFNEAIEIVDKANNKAVFFLNPTPIVALKEVARARKTMPQKSTYFYPKPLTGLVINSLLS